MGMSVSSPQKDYSLSTATTNPSTQIAGSPTTTMSTPSHPHAGEHAGAVITTNADNLISLPIPPGNNASVLRYPFTHMNMSWWVPYAKVIASENSLNTPLRIALLLVAHAIIHEDPFLENAITYITSRHKLIFSPEETCQFTLYKLICRTADYPPLSDLKRLSLLKEEERNFVDWSKEALPLFEKKFRSHYSNTSGSIAKVRSTTEEVCQQFQSLRQHVETACKNGNGSHRPVSDASETYTFLELMNSFKKLFLYISPGTGIDMPRDGRMDTFVCCEGCPCYPRIRSMHTVFLRDVEKAKVIDCIMMAAVKEGDAPLRNAASELLYNHFRDFMENPYINDVSYFIQNGKLFFARMALFDAYCLTMYITQSVEQVRTHKDYMNRIVIPLLWVKNEIRNIRGLHELVPSIDKALMTAETSYMRLGRNDHLQVFHTIRDYVVTIFSALSEPKYHLAVHSRDVFAGKPLDMKCANPSCDGSTRDLLKCSGCDMTYYCSAECQKADWDTHKILCHEMDSRRGKPVPVEANFTPMMQIKTLI